MTRQVTILRVFLALAMALAPLLARAQEMTIPVAEGQGQVVRLSRSAANVFVGDPNVAAVQAVSDVTLFISGVNPGTTNVFALDREDQLIASYEVVVNADTGEASGVLGSAGPQVQSQGNTAVVVGTARDVDEAIAALQARRVLIRDGRNTLDRTQLGQAGQVSLRVRFVEASRRDLLQLGFDLSAIDEGVFEVAAGGRLARSLARGGGGFGQLGGTPLTRAGISGSIGDLSIDAVLNALEERGIVQILSEPTLTTVSGRRATFQAGGEFVVPVPQGDFGTAVEFRSFGVSIAFLPIILPDGRISVEVAPEVSFLDDSNGVTINDTRIPGLSVRRAETTVEVGSGQTFAIAGLYEQRSEQSGSGVPGLRRAPIIGPLFDQRNRSSNARELVIFITPYLADASNAADRAPPRPRVVDTVGFILE